MSSYKKIDWIGLAAILIAIMVGVSALVSQLLMMN